MNFRFTFRGRRDRSIFSSILVMAMAAELVLLVNSAPAAADPPSRFEDVTKQAGLIEPLKGILGHGGAWGDYNRDGRIDLFVGGFCDRPNERYGSAGRPVPTRLLKNLGDGRFERVDQSATRMHARTSGALFVDLNNGGTLELYVANNARASTDRSEQPQRRAKTSRSRLLRHKDGQWGDVTEFSGAVPDGLLSARNVVPLDYNADGRLDLLVIEDRFVRGTPRTLLLRNDGDLKFTIANEKANLPNDLYGLGAAVADLNGDGRGDLFIPHSNRLFLSRGDGTYREATELRDVFAWEPLDAEDWPCGAAFGDLNRDGRLDLVLSIHHNPARNRVFLNEGLGDGVPRFRDVSGQVGLDAAIPARCPHVEVQDFDNDGRMDLYFSAAWRDDASVVPLVYRNVGVEDGLPRFEPPRPVESPMHYYPAGPSGDFDNDGRRDLFLINWFEGNRCRLMRNVGPTRHWLDIRIVGRTINRMGIGTKLHAYKAGRLGEPDALLGYQQMQVGYGYASGQPAVCHFGLGSHQTVDLRATLPNGETVERREVEANQQIVIEEPESE